MFPSTTTIFLSGIFSLPLLSAAQYSATYLPSNAPNQTEQGQSGTNQCGTGSDPNSPCQNSYLNSLTDFCLFAPPNPGSGSAIGNTERIEVSWCLKPGYGARLIPEGAITGAHFVQTPDYVQITGVGDLTRLNIPAGDGGGELDPHGADGNGNPIGGLVFSSAFGSLAQVHEWTEFIGSGVFCFRACKDGPKAAALCEHIYDLLGCDWNMPANYDPGVFESCLGDTGEPMGVYGSSTFYQGQPVTPPAHSAPPSSSCITVSNLDVALTTPRASSSTATTTPPASTPASSSSASRSSGGSAAATSSTSASQRPIAFSWQGLVLPFGLVMIGCTMGAGLVL